MVADLDDYSELSTEECEIITFLMADIENNIGDWDDYQEEKKNGNNN